MLADPPIYLPWLIFAACIVVLAWAVWPHKKPEPPAVAPAGGTASTTHGPHSPAIGAVTGNVTFNNMASDQSHGPTVDALLELRREQTLNVMREQLNQKPHHPAIEAARKTFWDRPLPPVVYDCDLDYVVSRLRAIMTDPRGQDAPVSVSDDKINLRIKDAVFNRKMHVWGRKGKDGTLIPLDHYLWDRASLDHAKGTVRIKNFDNPTRPSAFWDLHFVKSEADAAFPPRPNQVIL